MDDKLEVERKTELKAVTSFIVIISIIVVTVLGIIVLKLTKKEAKVAKEHKLQLAVDAVAVSESNRKVEILTNGVVESLRETSLSTEVQGRVIEISPNFKRGGRVKKGEVLVKLDDADYLTALASAKVAFADAELALEQEKARVEQAQLDWNKLGRGEPKNELVLRAPYLKSADAKAQSARQQVEKAQRDLDRTEIAAPFDAGVRTANVEVGAVVAPGTTVSQLYSVEDIEVRLPLSLDDYGYLERDSDGNIRGEVVLKGRIGIKDYEWSAVPVRVDSEIDRKTLSASVIVKVNASVGSEFPLPPVGLFVDAKVSGKTLDRVIEVPRRALLDGNRVVVVLDTNKIEIRQVRIIRSDEHTVWIGEGVRDGERVVLTRLSAPVQGMEVVVESGQTKEGK